MFEATLLGANEVAPVQTGAAGHVVAMLEGDLLRISGSFDGLGSAYAASHIHSGATGVNGPVVFPLHPMLGTDGKSGVFSQTITLSKSQIAALSDAAYYVNVHSADHAGGEIRGQLFSAETRAFFTSVFGEGLSPAFGRVHAALNGTELRVNGFFASLSAAYASASFHVGSEEAIGPAFFLNANPDANNMAGTFLSQRNIIRLTDALVEALVEHRLWVRIYESGRPESAARGRLELAEVGFMVFEAALSGFNQIPQANSAAVGRVTGILTPPSLGIHRLHVIGSFDYLEGDFTEAALYMGGTGEAGLRMTTLDEIPGIWPDNRYGQVLRTLTIDLSPVAAEAIRDGRMYIKVSSTAYPDGELRGQLWTLETRTAYAHLSGAAEVPPVNTTASGIATLVVNGSVFRVTGSFGGLTGDFTTAQLHIGRDDEATAPFMTIQPVLEEDQRSGVILASAANSGVFMDAQVVALDAGELYINVYSTAYTAGEIRGHFRWPTEVGAENPAELPDRLRLAGNFPNPFNPATRIVFDLPVAADVRIDVFDMLGRRVLMQQTGLMPPAKDHSVLIEAGDLPSGTYVYRVSLQDAGRHRAVTGRMVLLR